MTPTRSEPKARMEAVVQLHASGASPSQKRGFIDEIDDRFDLNDGEEWWDACVLPKTCKMERKDRTDYILPFGFKITIKKR